MTTTAAGLELRPLVIPASLEASDAADFVAMVTVRNQVYRELCGHDDHAVTAGELLPHYQPNAYEQRYCWLLLDDGRPVGRAGLDLPNEEGSRVGYWLVELLREAHGRGLGSQAYAEVERTARRHGRTVLQSWAQHNEAPGERLAAPTGFGSVPAQDAGVRFYRKHGYVLEQIERCSVLDLREPFDAIEQLFAEARAAARGDRLVSWFLPTPSEYVDGYAWMKSRMATDAPAAGLEFDEEVWDAARVALHDSRYLEGGQTVRVAAAQHIETGELAAFSELSIRGDAAATSHQEDTLVLKHHRGNRLGALVKCDNLLAWRSVAPLSPRVMTYNAEENRPMLDVNEALGFVPLAYEGAWKKVLE